MKEEPNAFSDFIRSDYLNVRKMKEIKLSQQGKNKGKYVVLVDDDVFELVNKFKWHVTHGKNTSYARRTVWIDGKKHHLWLHRIIMNTPEWLFVDHKDMNGLNCTRNNMRNCTVRQNKCNRISYGSSKYLGVGYCLIDGKKRIRAQIRIDGKKVHLGLFDTEEKAAYAYDAAAKNHHGEFANLNFK